MSDYIKREDAIDRVCELGTGMERRGKTLLTMVDVKYLFIGILETLPSADVAPVRHGRWTHERLPSTSGGSYAVVRCSACEYQYPMAETRYCPNCGAKMDDGYILITGKEQI